MKFADTLRSAAQSLRAHLTRSSLTVLGLSIGVGASIAIGSLGTAAVREVRGEMSRFGVDRVWVEGNAGNARGLEESDVQALRALGDAAAPVSLGAAKAQAGLKSASCVLVATTADYYGIENLHLASGRFLMAQDEEHLLHTVVLEDTLAEALFGQSDPLGRSVTAGGVRCTVVGVLETYSSPYFAGDGKPKAYLPAGVWRQSTGRSGADEIVLRAPGADVGYTASLAKAALQALHPAEDGFTVSSMAEQIESSERILSIITTVLAVVGAICMMTGGVGVMNVMLTSVRERRREIGIRKALGARDREIFAQFFCEAALYGALGAAAGSAMGFLLTYAGESIVGVPAPMQGWVVLLAVGFSCGVGAVSGIRPAMRAAAVPPVTAMRQM